MNHFEAATVNDLWRQALSALTSHGECTSPRGQGVRELRGVTLTLTDPRYNILTTRERKLNYHFLVAEWLWMRFGHRDVATIAAFNRQLVNYSDDGLTFFGAYGPRIVSQLDAIVTKLTEDPDSRQAVLEIWRPEALTAKTLDVPCTLTWQFFIRNGKLEMHANMRSNDIWLGFPYDIFNFTQIQHELASRLGVKLGNYVHHVGSLHLYDQHVIRVIDILIKSASRMWLARSPGVPEAPPRWLDIVLTELATGVSRRGNFTLRGGGSPWFNYASVLVHRFSKRHEDLAEPWSQVIP